MANIDDTSLFLGVPTTIVAAWNENGAPVPDDTNNPRQVQALSQWLADSAVELSRRSAAPFPTWVLNSGFFFGLALSVLCFIAAAWHLSSFQSALSNPPTNSPLAEDNVFLRTISSKMALITSGTISAIALGFLGLSLFLVGVQGSTNVEASAQSYQTKLVNVAPGTLVLVCAIGLIALLMTRNIEVTQTSMPQPANAKPVTDLSLKFSVPVSFVIALQAEVDEAQRASSVELKRTRLEKIWFLADTVPSLINGLQSDATLSPKSAQQIAALKACLAEVSRTTETFDANPQETINKIRQILNDLSAKLKAP